MDNFDGIFVPADIWNNKELSIEERIYLAVYEQEKVVATTEMTMLWSMSPSTVYRVRKSLQAKNYIKQIDSPYEAKQTVLNLVGVGEECEWCHNKTLVLHEHHFPISKSDGGTEVVRICPNCHANYHKIMYNEG